MKIVGELATKENYKTKLLTKHIVIVFVFFADQTRRYINKTS